MQRNERLERNPGIYAFVVHGTLRYLGKATYLRSRLRAYNRSLKDDSKREHRRVHVGIRDIWRSGGRIDVWVLYLPGVSSEKLYQREHRWIKETSPDWNAT